MVHPVDINTTLKMISNDTGGIRLHRKHTYAAKQNDKISQTTDSSNG
jgi:hypothetical protein